MVIYKNIFFYFLEMLIIFGLGLLIAFPIIFGLLFVLVDFVVYGQQVSWGGFLEKAHHVFVKLLPITPFASVVSTIYEYGRIKKWSLWVSILVAILIFGLTIGPLEYIKLHRP